MIGDGDIRKSLREVADFLRERSEETGYGFMRPENPHDFRPDTDSCTEAEIAAHKAACNAWDRGEYQRADAPTVKAGEPLPDGVQSALVAPDGAAIHATYAPWGIGSYVMRDEEMLAMAAKLDALADELPGQEDAP